MISNLQFINSILIGVTGLLDQRVKDLDELTPEKYYDTKQIKSDITDGKNHDLKQLCNE